MAVIPSMNLKARDFATRLSRRSNWAGHEAGVIVVFCIVFLVVTGIIALAISRWLSRRRAAKAARK